MNSPARPLSGQVAVVTGASSGIGRGVAEGLAHAGASVVVNYLGGTAKARAVCRSIVADGGRAIAVKADVSKEHEVERLFAQAAELGPLDILVANSGLQDDAKLAEMTLAQWQNVLAVNLTGAFLCAREALRHFRPRRPRSGARGKIVFMSSVHERIPWSGHVNYAASKGGMKMLMQSLAQEVACEGIRVNSIAPGFIRTAINKSEWDSPAKLKRLLKLVPYGRAGKPEDIAKAAVWLASDESDYVTGTTLFVDGGMSLYPGFLHNG